MKKILKTATAAVLCTALIITGCGKTGDDGPYDYDLSNYVSLGEYLGLEVPAYDFSVTDEEVRNEIRFMMEIVGDFETIDSGVVREWDVANIDFVGFLDGVAFEGGMGIGFDLTIGSGEFVPGFEDGLIGKTIGETLRLELTFPDEYYPELAGQDVEFEVRVNWVERMTEITLEDYVADFSSFDTLEELEDFIREDLSYSKEVTAESDRKDFLWGQLMNNSTILGYPAKETREYVDEIVQAEQAYARTMNKSWSDYLEQDMQMSEEEFNELINSYAQSQVGMEMIIFAVARQEGIERPTDEEFEESRRTYMADMGFTSDEDFRAAYGQSFEDAVGRKNIEMFFFFNRILELMMNSAVEV